MQYLLLIPLGVIVGTFGTLIGAGGGFILVPVLLLLYPNESPEIITSISLAIVFFNALSGSFAYARMRRIDYKSGAIFSLATIPGSILGAITTSVIPRQIFNGIFGVILILISLFLLLRPKDTRTVLADTLNCGFLCKVVENDDTVHEYSYNLMLGIGISLVVGYVSSVLGIGGGIIHVPALVNFLNFPIHIATATSHFILAFMALVGTIVHISTGTFSHGLHRTIFLAIGVLFGAQVGARLSNRIKGNGIIRSLAVALGFVGVRILLMVFTK